MISHRHNAIFVHVPKCAGETVNHYLNRFPEFVGVHQTYDFTRQIDDLFPYKYYFDIVGKAKQLYGYRGALKTSVTHLKYLGKQVLEFNSDKSRIPDEVSGKFRIGAYRRMERSIDPSTWNNAYKFTFVRNPYDRAVSSWSFLTSESRGDSRIEINFPSFIDMVVNGGFDIFLPTLKKEQIVDLEWHTMPQTTHLKNERGIIDIDFIGKIENFIKDLTFVLNRLQVSNSQLEKVRLNKSQHKAYKEYYTKELQEKVFQYYKEDFDFLGYDQEMF